MRRVATQALLLGLVAVAVVACGGSSHKPSSAAAKTVLAALNRLGHESYREHVAVTTKYDTSGLTAAVASRFAAAPTQITVDGAIETPQRMSIVETIPPELENAHVLIYDGAAYIALEGTHYTRLTGALATSVNGLTSIGAAGVAGYLTDVSALGSTTFDGQPTEHYEAGLNPNGVRALTGKLAGPLGLNAGALGIAKSRVDIYLGRAGGQVVGLVTTSKTTLDLAKLVAPATASSKLTGTLKLQQVSTAEISAIGVKLSVQPPSVTP